MKIVNADDIIQKYSHVVADPESANEEAIANRTEELMKLTKAELVQMILAGEARNSSGIKVGDLAKMILQDEELVTASHNDVAEAVRQLIPGSKCSHKSIATYVSKKRDEWNLPDRIQIRKARPRKETTEPEEAEVVQEDA